MNIILNPIITEKSMNDVGQNRFTFKVEKGANKNTIKAEIEKRFKVNVIGISTTTVKGKTVSVRTRTRADKIAKQPFKKATVTLKSGQKISLFDTGAK